MRAGLRRRIEAVEAAVRSERSAAGGGGIVESMLATIPQDDRAIAKPGPTKWWTPQKFHEGQCAAFYSTARFRAIECGRRSGKSEGRKREVIIRALDPSWPLPDRYIVVGGPTQLQTMKIYWRHLLRLIPPGMLLKERKSEFEIELVNGALIRVLGMDKPQRAEGDPIDHLFLDEFADMRAEALDEHLRPSLDTPERPPGTLTVFGTPDMRSGEHFVRLCDDFAKKQREGDPNYAHFRWTSEGIIRPDAFEEARNTLDPVTFAVEYLAERRTTGNRAYYTFDPARHVVDGLALVRTRPLIVALDWNWDPGVAVFAQEQTREDYHPATALRFGPSLASPFTAVLGEVFIRRSNTPAVLRSVLAWIEKQGHVGQVYVYGDPAGGAQGAAQVDGSNLDLCRKILGPALGDRLSMRFAASAPKVVARLNAVNSRLMTAAGTVRMVLARDRAIELERDLNLVALKEGAHHVEIDKPTSGEGKMRSHLSDALGYYIDREFPVREIQAGVTVDG